MLISIVIPVFNREAFLPRLFASLLKAPYSPLEIVLVDNGSTDSSTRLCEEFKRQHSSPLFSVVTAKELKRGACACRNKGFELSKGRFVYFFDSDDELSHDFLKDAAAIITGNDKLQMVCAPTTMVLADGRTKTRDYFDSTDISDQIISSMLSTQSIIVERDFFKACGLWNELLPRWNDWELGTKLLMHHPRTVWIKGKSYHRIYQHNDSISGNTYAEDFPKLLFALKTVKREILDSTTISPPERRKACMALRAKTLMLLILLRKEKANRQAAECKRFADSIAVRKAFKAYSIAIATTGIPGAWRLLRLGVNLFK